MAHAARVQAPGAPRGGPGAELEPAEARARLRRAASLSSIELERWLRGHWWQAALGALLAGMVLGSSARVRRGLSRLASRWLFPGKDGRPADAWPVGRRSRGQGGERAGSGR
ncbi:MAG: hypothetical protein FJ125_09345 [Deltaproteobacteria bacterium]|nr:hypothetical protein [Deltaproteobacteria bacterium]